MGGGGTIIILCQGLMTHFSKSSYSVRKSRFFHKLTSGLPETKNVNSSFSVGVQWGKNPEHSILHLSWFNRGGPTKFEETFLLDTIKKVMDAYELII